jgi:hypothetical protein
MDFTLKTYYRLIETLQSQGFSFQTFAEFIEKPKEKSIVLRHDVDRLPGNSLTFAVIQAEKDIKGTYYFRAVPGSWDYVIIKKIREMGHEVGYHYEDFSFASKKLKVKSKKSENKNKSDRQDRKTARPQDNGCLEKKLADIAIENFSKNLERLRGFAPVKTICMHGSPMSRWDSRLLWKYYDYHDFGIIGEPYLDIDFNEVLYLTDTGRRWDGGGVNIRDKGLGIRDEGIGEKAYKDWKVKPQEINSRIPHTARRMPFPKFHTTFDIIKAAEEDRLPDKIMMTFHPQRWTDRPVPWVRELVWQNVKNVGKYLLIKMKD